MAYNNITNKIKGKTIMKQHEIEEIEHLPEKYKPLGAWTYFGCTILFAIPIVGLVFLVIFAVSDKNINRRSFARSYFCVYILVAIISIIMAASGAFSAIFGGMGA